MLKRSGRFLWVAALALAAVATAQDASAQTAAPDKTDTKAVQPCQDEIRNKVKAKHGATTGKLDDQMLFYLLSRGIDRPTAQSLLQWAFIEDAVSLVDLPELRREIESLAASQLLAVSGLPGLLGDRP